LTGDWHAWNERVRAVGGTELGVYGIATTDFSLGCLTVITDTASAEYESALELFCEQIAALLEKARMNQVAQHTAEQLEFQHRLLRELADSRDNSSIVEVLGVFAPGNDEDCTIALVSFDEFGRGALWREHHTTPTLLDQPTSSRLIGIADTRLATQLDVRGVRDLLDGPTAGAMCIGLVRSDRSRGLLIATTPTNDTEQLDDIAEFLSSAAAPTTIGLANAMSFQSEMQHADRLTRASDLAARMSGTGSAAILADRLAAGVHDVFAATKVSVYLNAKDGALERSACSGNDLTHRLEFDLVDRRTIGERTRRGTYGERHAYAVQLMDRGTPLGTLYVEVDATDTALLDDADVALLETIAETASGSLAVIVAHERIEMSYKETIQSLLSALEASDQYTAAHSDDVADWAVEVGRRLGMEDEELRTLELGAIFHDIGKIAIPSEILNKPGKLTDEEFEVMKNHTVAGERIIAPIEFLQSVRPIVRHEHERWDGAGYPDGLEGSGIPLGSRIIFVCDAYHAITSDRPYREARSSEIAKQILLDNAGTQFDPAVVSVFLQILEDRDAAQPRRVSRDESIGHDPVAAPEAGNQAA
jgi:HD-GYP domain-containing protein (c-di-GMP phosphodiesterase class II)